MSQNKDTIVRVINKFGKLKDSELKEFAIMIRRQKQNEKPCKVYSCQRSQPK